MHGLSQDVKNQVLCRGTGLKWYWSSHVFQSTCRVGSSNVYFAPVQSNLYIAVHFFFFSGDTMLVLVATGISPGYTGTYTPKYHNGVPPFQIFTTFFT